MPNFPTGIALRQFTSRWEGGNGTDFWQLAARAVMRWCWMTPLPGWEYTLPGNWKQLWMESLPTWLESLTLKKFSASRNLGYRYRPHVPVADHRPLNGYGGELQLVKDRRWA